jgi:type IV pilus assembly protein PilM
MLNFINRFTEEQVIGLNISDFSAEAVILEKASSHWKVYSFSRFRLSPGIVENGQILQAEKLKEELKKLFAQAQPHPMKASSVFLSLPDSHVFARVLSLPKTLRHKDLLLAAQNKAEEFVPEDTNNLIATFKVLPVNNGQAEVFYAAAKKDLVLSWANFFEDMNLDVIGITMESISSLAGLSDQSKQETALLLDIGSRTTIASIFDKDGIKDSIVIQVAGNSLTDAIAAKLGISHLAAEEKKQQIGMDASIDQGEIMWIIQGQLQPVADELKKFITFHEENTGQKIKNLLLIGGTSQTKGIEKYFGSNLNLTVLTPETIVDYNKFKLAEYLQAVKYVNAFGLARLAHEAKVEINFYQTVRVNLQQRVDWQNIGLWLKAILNFIKNFPKLFKTRLAWFFLVLLFAAVFIVWRYDDIMAKFLPSQQIFSQEIIVSTENQAWPNFIPVSTSNQVVFVKQIFPGLTYPEAVAQLTLMADNLALNKALSSEKTTQYVVEDVINREIVSLLPGQSDFEIGDELTLKADYVFWSIDKQDVRNFILSNLSPQEAAKYAEWQIAGQDFVVLEALNLEENENNSMKLQAKLTLRKAVD